MIHQAMAHLRKHRAYDIAFIALVSLAATSNWLNSRLPKGHDAMADILSARAAYSSASLCGVVPGWASDWFMGYPRFYMHPPLSSLMVMLSSLPFGWVVGAKLLFLSFFVLSGVFAYLYVHELTKNRLASVAAGLAYVFLPYHIIDVGFEGHQGSFSTPYMLTPLILLCLERSIRKPGIKYVLVNGMLLALLILTFPQVFPILVGPFLVLYVILRIWWERSRGREYLRSVVIASLATLCLSLLLTAFWWLPLISDIRYSYATSFSVEEARDTSASFIQALTLRPSLCCAPSSAYGSAGSVFLEMLRILPFILVLGGIILNRKNRHVWFFSLSILIAVVLAMGPLCPVDVFGFAHRYLPLFSRLRTPVRFLLFASLAYSVMIGFFIQAIADRMGRLQPKHGRLKVAGIPFLVPILVGLIIVGNTWQETRTAFSTFSLTGDQEQALAYLAGEEGGDYRIADPPFDPYVYDADAGEIIRPVFWTYLHGKETLSGPGSSMSVKFTAGTLDSLNARIKEGPFDMSQWLSTFNVKYVLLDKTDPFSSNVILDDGFERVWTSETIDIYKNHDVMPRVFAVSVTNERTVDLWNGDDIVATPTRSDSGMVLSLDAEHIRTSDRALKATYIVTGTETDAARLAIDVHDISLSADDAVRLVFYSPGSLPDISIGLDVLEQDGSKYGTDMCISDGISAGWNETYVPLSLFSLRDSTDENHRLDADQIQSLSFGPTSRTSLEGNLRFSLYFDELTTVTQHVNTSVEYTKVRPGKYEVRVSLDSPGYLILSESYHPDWIACVNGESNATRPMYECLNGLYLEPGEYNITLEFTTSPLRTAANVISSLTILLVCFAGVLLLVRKWRRKRTPAGTPADAEPSR